MPTIRSSSDLQRNIAEIYSLCHETKEPVYITRNGQADLVVMDVDAFEQRCELRSVLYEREMNIYRNAMAAQAEYEAGKLILFAEIRRTEADARSATHRLTCCSPMLRRTHTSGRLVGRTVFKF